MARIRVLVMSGMLVSTCAASALAAWPASPLLNLPVCTAAGRQTLSVIVGDGASGAIAVWEDSRGGNSIYAQRVNEAGIPRWAANGVPVATGGGSKVWCDAVSDGAGGVVVAWAEYRNGSESDIFAQHLNGGGAPLWATNGVPVCTASGNQYAPKLTPDGSGGVVLVWTDERVAPFSDFHAQRLNSAGDTQWALNGVALTTGLIAGQAPAVAGDDSAGVIVAWHGSVNGSLLHPYVQRLDAAGQRRWGKDGVLLATVSTQYDPCLVRDGEGGAIVMWTDLRDGDGNTGVSYAQRVSADGVPQWTAGGVALSDSPGDHGWNALVSDAGGGAIAVWSDLSSTEIRAQRVNGTGATSWPLVGVSVGAASNGMSLFRAVSDGSGGVLVTWMDERNGDSDVYLQRVDFAGVTLWPTDGVPVSTAPLAQMGPELIADGTGGAVVGWSDFRLADDLHVYAQRVSASGALGGSVLGVPRIERLGLVWVRATGNPGHAAVALECQLAGPAPALLEVFDVSGRCRAKQDLVGGRAPVQVRIPVAGWSPGVYMVRLAQGAERASTRLVLTR